VALVLPRKIRKDGRVVECARLEIWYTVHPYRGFKSLSFRQKSPRFDSNRAISRSFRASSSHFASVCRNISILRPSCRAQKAAVIPLAHYTNCVWLDFFWFLIRYLGTAISTYRARLLTFMFHNIRQDRYTSIGHRALST
jgi:hypothetical protein